EKSSRPFNKFPQDDIGSITPSPSMLNVASVKTNSGIEIQNCANITGRRFGATWRVSNLHLEQPDARANNTKSASRRLRAAPQTTRRDAGQPSTPSNTNVAMTEMTGEMFNGSTARNASSTSSSGSESDKSPAARMIFSHQPLANPARQPNSVAIA